MTKAIGNNSNPIFVAILKQNLAPVWARFAPKNYILNSSKNELTPGLSGFGYQNS
jgi:hypothetical protein